MFEQFDSPRAQALARQRKELTACVLAHVYSILQIPHGILLFKRRFDNFWILKF